MKRASVWLLLLGVIFTASISTSCKKKCRVDDLSQDTGEIIDSVTIIPSSGSLTGNMGSDFVIDGDHQHANAFQIRFNDSARVNVDYSKYFILANPMIVNCNVAFERNVTIDNANQQVIYAVKATQCADCNTTNYIENYVLVPAFPSNYEVIFDTVVITKN